MSFAQVQEFNDTFGVRTRQPVNDLFAEVRVPEAKLRFELIREEFEELTKAYKEADIVELADALGDIKYVVIGAAQVFGLSTTVEHALKAIEEDFSGKIVNEDLQQEVLQYLRLSILRNDASSAAATLATMLKLVDDAAVFFDIRLDEIVTAIHKSNMSKLTEDGKVVRRPEDNKVLKSDLYKAPTADLEFILFGEANVESE